MKSIRMRGNWYLPAAKGRPVPGTLLFRHDYGLHLVLEGSFAEDHGESADQQPMIWGVVDKGFRGLNFVTLREAFRTKWTIGVPGLQRERYRVQAAYFGTNNFELPLAVTKCAVRFDLLDQWTGTGRSWWRGLRFDENGLPQYNEPTPLAVQVAPGHIVRVRPDLQWRSRESTFSASVHALFESEWGDAISDRDAIRDTLTPATQLLGFVSGESVSVREVRLQATVDDRPVFMLAPWVGAEKARHKTATLFSFSDVAIHFETFVSRWYELRAAHLAFFGSFFGFLAAPPKFAEQKLQTLLHCVALLAGNGSHQTKGGDVFRRRSTAVGWLLEQLNETLLHGPLNDLPATYLDELRDAEYSVEVGSPVSGIQLVWLAESTKWLLWANLLRELIPDPAVVSRILEHNDKMRYALGRLGGQAQYRNLEDGRLPQQGG